MTIREPLAASVAAWALLAVAPPLGRFGRWRLKPDADAGAFVASWREIAKWTLETQPLAAGPFLLRDEDDPREFTGWWPFGSAAEYVAFRDSDDLRALLAPLGEMLERIDEQVLRLVATPVGELEGVTLD